MNPAKLIQQKPLATLLSIYFILTLFLITYWHIQDKNTVTGDEPHYLIMAKGMFQYGQLEQTRPYQEEFQQQAIYPGELAPVDAKPTPANTHGVNGPRGMYNVHNLGLPLLLGIPLIIGGVMGAKVFLIMLNAAIVVLAWKFTGLLTTTSKIRFYATLLVSLSMPLLPAAGQVFPDLLAGSITLAGLYWLFSYHHHKPLRLTIGWMLLIVYLPWLQIKFIPIMLILGVAMSYVDCRHTQCYQRAIRFSLLLIASVVAIFAYHYYAFGKLSGPYPYQGAGLEISQTALVVLTGLFIDQNHGFLLQNPIMFVGLFMLGFLFKYYRKLALVWALLFLGLIVPNGLHNAWYGGYSFLGRFQWSAYVIFIIPTLIGLVKLGTYYPRAFVAITVSGILLQGYFYLGYASGFIEMYNRGRDYVYEYAEFYGAVYEWFPILFKAAWAYQHPANLAWILITFSIVLTGIWTAYRTKAPKPYWLILIGGILITAVVSAGWIAPDYRHVQYHLSISKLSGQTGFILNNTRQAIAQQDPPGYLSYGPYLRLPEGHYRLQIDYRLNLPKHQQGGNGDVYTANDDTQHQLFSLMGTDGTNGQLSVEFDAGHGNGLYEFRLYWDGIADIALLDMQLEWLGEREPTPLPEK